MITPEFPPTASASATTSGEILIKICVKNRCKNIKLFQMLLSKGESTATGNSFKCLVN